MTAIYITGIDTDIGKTIATGLMAKFLYQKGIRVITQKMVQTGCQHLSEDIQAHRELTGCGLLKEDTDGTTCPYLFTHAASPHLAAQMENKTIDPDTIFCATQTLSQNYSLVLVEGAGGLFVPLNPRTTIIEYMTQHPAPVILVSSSRLGSINHTLLSIEALKARNLDLLGIVYNQHPKSDPAIEADSIRQMAAFMKKSGYPDCIIPMGEIDIKNPTIPDFTPLFKTVRP